MIRNGTRARETVRLAQLPNSKPQEELGDGGHSMQAITDAQAAWLKNKVAQFPRGADTILATHLPKHRARVPAVGIRSRGWRDARVWCRCARSRHGRGPPQDRRLTDARALMRSPTSRTRAHAATSVLPRAARRLGRHHQHRLGRGRIFGYALRASVPPGGGVPPALSNVLSAIW